MGDCPCVGGGAQAPQVDVDVGCGAPVVPIIPPGVPHYQVTQPCMPDQPGICQDVCVPIVPPAAVTVIPPPERRRCRYIQPQRPKSFAPIRRFRPPELKMEDNTIYRKSYLPVETEKPPDPILPRHNVCLGEGGFSKDTINKMSYQGHKDILPPCPILPCNHKLLGDGPMQDITTNKHDYVPKPATREGPILPIKNLYPSDCPLSDKTTNRMSYVTVDPSKSRVEPILPVPALEKPSGKFEQNTIQKMSYLPWQPQERIETPWAVKPKFAPPALRMQDDTINKLSYMPPGQYVECADDDPCAIQCPSFPRAAC